MAWLFKPATHIASDSQILSGVRYTTALRGRPIPIVYGQSRIAANLIGYWDFNRQNAPQPISGGKGGFGTSGGKGGNQQQFVYFASIVLALCEGPIIGIGNIWNSTGQLPLNTVSENFTVPAVGGTYQVAHFQNFQNDLGVAREDTINQVVNDPGSQGPITLGGIQLTPMAPVSGAPGTGQYSQSGGTYRFAPGDGGKIMVITYIYSTPNTDSSGVPIQQLNFTTFFGTRPQNPWPYLTTNHPGHDFTYEGLAYLTSQNAPLGNSGMIPPMTFEVFGLLPFSAGIKDCNPRDIIIDFLTNPFHGVADGIPLSRGWTAQDIGDLTIFSNYCVANGLFFSPVIDEQRAASDYIKDFLEAANSEPFISSGQLKIVPYGEMSVVGNGVTYTPPTQPIFDLNDDDYVTDGKKDPMVITRPTPQDAFNVERVEYWDRVNSYNPSIIEAFDQDSTDKIGRRQDADKAFHFITNQQVAAAVAQTILSRSVNVRNKFEALLTARYIPLDPMDVCTHTDILLGLNKTPLRLKSIEEQANGTLKTVWEEMPFSTSSPTLYPKQLVTSTPSPAQALPGPINTPVLIEAWSRMNDQIGHSIIMGISGGVNVGGCTVWASKDGVNYKTIGQFTGNSRMGTLTATFASHTDPDTTDTLSVDLSQSRSTLASGTASDCDSLLTICWVDGELISYQTATPTTAFNYNIGTRIRRGVFGSPINSHSSGAQFLRLDDSVFKWDFDPSQFNATIFFKFTTFNQFRNNEEPLSTVTAYSITLSGLGLGLLTPGHVTYRPLTNPLTGHDAGASATVNIAAFTMRIPGLPDIPYNSGAITGLSYNTIYFIYLDDPSFAGQFNGSVTYAQTTTKEVALIKAGRFFIGSIRTPKATQPDTVGFGDGGVGTQSGMLNIIPFGSITSSSQGNGAVTNLGNIIDGDLSSFANITATCTGLGNNNNVTAVLNGPPGLSRRYASVTSVVALSVSQNNISPPQGLVCIRADVFFQGSLLVNQNIFSILENAGTQAFTIFTLALPDPSINLAALSIHIFVGCVENTGGLNVNVYDAHMEGIE